MAHGGYVPPAIGATQVGPVPYLFMPRKKEEDAGVTMTLRIKPTKIARAKALTSPEKRLNAVLNEAIDRGLPSLEREQVKKLAKKENR